MSESGMNKNEKRLLEAFRQMTAENRAIAQSIFSAIEAAQETSKNAMEKANKASSGTEKMLKGVKK